MSFPKYPEYYYSELKWLGDIPKNWSLIRLKHLFKLVKRPVRERDEIVTCFRDGTVTLRSNRRTEGFTNAVQEIGYQGIRKGDLIIHAMDAFAGAIGVSDSDGKASPVYSACVASSDEQASADYYGKLLRSMALSGFVTSLAKGIRERSTDFRWSDAGEVFLPVPSIAEQTQIARFLDHETAKIDALIREQERLIELLQEKRQAVISHAVTKGLDPNVPMKDSGVEWLGEVPAHWKVVPFGFAISYQEGPGIMASDFHDKGVPLIRVSGVRGRWASMQGCNFLDPEKVKRKWKHFQLNRGDLLISASASMGTICEVGSDTEGSIPYTGIIRLTPQSKVSHKDFIRAIVGSDQFYTQIDLFKAGSTIQHFGPTHLSQMKVVLPPLEEQVSLAKHVDTVVSKFKSLIDQAKSGNTLLQERRSALISAAVTGKIDVRGWQPPTEESAFPEEVREAGIEVEA